MLDLSTVPFANPTGLRWLVALDGILRARSRALRVLVRPGSPTHLRWVPRPRAGTHQL